MPTTVYRSTDTSAPVLTGTAGDLTNLLDKCLVDGYGSQDPAGWAASFTGTNKRVYRAPAGRRYYLRIQDDAPGAGGAREARMRAYETMSDVDTGLNPFPTVAQNTNGMFVRKSASADALARPWIVIADGRTVYAFVLTGDTAGIWYPWMFGDFFTFRTGTDFGQSMVIGRNTENSSSAATAIDGFDAIQGNWAAHTAGTQYMARTYTGEVGSTALIKIGDAALTAEASDNPFIGTQPHPNPGDNRYYLSPVRVLVTSPFNCIRGRMRGIWIPYHTISTFSDGDIFNGTGDLTGRTFLIIKQLPHAGVACMEISDTWDTNA